MVAISEIHVHDVCMDTHFIHDYILLYSQHNSLNWRVTQQEKCDNVDVLEW